MQTTANELPRDEEPERTQSEVEQMVWEFLTTEAGFAQVYTINRDGFPVGRTMVALARPNWDVDLVQRRVHRRIAQLRRNPKAEIVWAGSPRPDSVNDRPHVYDFGLAVPRAVFIRGTARFMSDEELVATYERQMSRQIGLGLTKAPVRTPQEVMDELIGVVIEAVQVRVEGFGTGARSYQWNPREEER
jgi:hypothetical protein